MSCFETATSQVSHLQCLIQNASNIEVRKLYFHFVYCRTTHATTHSFKLNLHVLSKARFLKPKYHFTLLCRYYRRLSKSSLPLGTEFLFEQRVQVSRLEFMQGLTQKGRHQTMNMRSPRPNSPTSPSSPSRP